MLMDEEDWTKGCITSAIGRYFLGDGVVGVTVRVVGFGVF